MHREQAPGGTASSKGSPESNPFEEAPCPPFKKAPCPAASSGLKLSRWNAPWTAALDLETWRKRLADACCQSLANVSCNSASERVVTVVPSRASENSFSRPISPIDSATQPRDKMWVASLVDVWVTLAVTAWETVRAELATP
jgi:hypothetical protein